MDRWTLPGPQRFLDAISESLRAGKSVVIGASAAASDLLSDVIASRMGDEAWPVTGPVRPGDASPLDCLHEELGIEDTQTSKRSVASLLAGLDRKKVVVVTGIDQTNWAAWKMFLERYEGPSLAVSKFDRTQFVVVAARTGGARLPLVAPGLEPLLWDGYIGEADLLNYFSMAWRQRKRRFDAQARLLARIITRIAVWDFDLVDRLLDVDPQELFTPAKTLRLLPGYEDDWQGLDASWESGGLGEFDGELCLHAMVLARANDPHGELSMRLWAAQAGELLPLLELKRRELVERMKRTSRLPARLMLGSEAVTDLNDIELGGLLAIARQHRLPTDIIDTADRYRQLRNKLAHLVPLSADETFRLFG